jgi:hypothetical protein
MGRLIPFSRDHRSSGIQVVCNQVEMVKSSHFTKTKDLIEYAKSWGIKRRWFESNKSLRKRINEVVKKL